MCQHNFCPNCAFPLTQTVQACPTCQASTLDGWSFCGSCGGVLPKTPKLLPVRTKAAEETSKTSPPGTDAESTPPSSPPKKRTKRKYKVCATERLQLNIGEEYWGWIEQQARAQGIKPSQAADSIFQSALEQTPHPAPIHQTGTNIKNKSYSVGPDTLKLLLRSIPKGTPKVAFVRGLLQREMQQPRPTPLPDDTTQAVATPEPADATNPPTT